MYVFIVEKLVLFGHIFGNIIIYIIFCYKAILLYKHNFSNTALLFIFPDTKLMKLSIFNDKEKHAIQA